MTLQVLELELVAQGELHYARVGEQSRIVSEVARIRKGQIQALYVKSSQVERVENVPTERQTVGLLVRHFPTLA